VKTSLIRAIILLIILLMIKPFQAYADNNETEIPVAFLPEARATLYAIKREANLEKFTLTINGDSQYFPYWRNVDSPTYKPKMLYKDINKDGQKELIIILTTDTGTEINVQDVHVFHKVKVDFGETYHEILVDNPTAIFLKNAKTSLTKYEAIITIENKKNIIKLDKFGIDSEHLFHNIGIGSIFKFDVVNNELTATLGLQVSPASFIGYIHISYIFKDNMYQVKKITLEKL
jgi:hypothetical protein